MPLDELPYLSIDLACPESCCGWGTDLEYYGRDDNFDWTVGLCDESLHVEAYWKRGKHSDLDVIASQAKPCGMTRHDFVTGYPRSVTTVDCWAAFPGWCKDGERTLALIAVNGSDMVTLNVSAFDANYEFDSCFAVKIELMFSVFIAFLVSGCVTLICICTLKVCRRDKANNTDDTEAFDKRIERIASYPLADGTVLVPIKSKKVCRECRGCSN